jgi:tetratricopeptide (TPR) repeat protein
MLSPETERRSPYQGLIPYSEDDAPFFFGREKETRLIIANLFSSPLTLLYGASGVGKSSVLRAGVAHQLSQREDLLVVVFNAWQSNPASDLGQAIADYADLADHAAWKKAVQLLPKDRPATLAELLIAAATQLNRRLMIILDQFEEYFLYHLQDDAFSDEFPRAVLQTEAPVNFLISIREDSLAKLDRFEGRIPGLFDNYFRIEHLDRKAARSSITKPIDKFNELHGESEVQLGPLLVETVLDQVQAGQVTLGETGRGIVQTASTDGQIETPYLQLVMTRLWDEEMGAKSRVLRVETLQTLGGAERIVRTRLDTAMSALPEAEQDIAAEVFHYLVTPSGTKIAHTVPDLADYAGVLPTSIAPVMEELARYDMRVLRGVPPPPDQPNQPRYEIFHDVLAAAVLDWRARYAQKKLDLQTKAEAEQKVREAQAESEKKLKEAQVEADRQLAEERSERMRESTRRLRRSLVAALFAVLMLSAVSLYAVRQTLKANQAVQDAQQLNEKLQKAYEELGKEKDNVENQKKEAETQRQLAEKRKGIAEEQRGIAQKRESEARTAQQQAIAAGKRADDARKDALFAAETERQNRMGLGEARAGHTDEAIRFFDNAYVRYSSANDRPGQVSALSNIGETYADLGGVPSFSSLFQLLESEDTEEQTSVTGTNLVEYLRLFAGLFKQTPAKSEEVVKGLADARSSAVVSYAHALVLNNKSDLKNEALILKRLGDISFIQGTEKSEDDANSKKEADTYFKQGIDYYVRAADAYHKANLSSPEISISYDEATVLRTAADALYPDINREVSPEAASAVQKEVDQTIDYYKRSAKAFAAANRTYQQAAVLSKIASIYKDVSKLYGKDMRKLSETRLKAIDHYRQVAEIYDRIDRPELAAPIYETLAELYTEEGGKVDDVLASYKLAFEDYIRAASHSKEKDKYYSAADSTLRTMVKFSGSLTDEEKKKMDSVFDNITEASQDPVRTAHILEIIGKEYSSEDTTFKHDKARGILYLHLESNILEQSGHFFEAARAAFKVLELYDALNDQPNMMRSFDYAISLYRKTNELGPDKKPLRAELMYHVVNAAVLVNRRGDYLRAIEAYEELLKLAPLPQTSAFDAVFTLVRIYLEHKDLANAERVVQEVLGQAKDRETTALALRNVGDSYAAAKVDPEKALSYYERSLAGYQDAYEHLTGRFYEKRFPRYGALDALRKASTMLMAQVDQSKAINYLTDLANTAAQSQNHFREASARHILGELYGAAADKEQLPADKSKQLDAAMAAYTLARAAYHSLQDKDGEADVLKEMSKIYAAKGDKATADQLSAEANKLLQSN